MIFICYLHHEVSPDPLPLSPIARVKEGLPHLPGVTQNSYEIITCQVGVSVEIRTRHLREHKPEGLQYEPTCKVIPKVNK